MIRSDAGIVRPNAAVLYAIFRIWPFFAMIFGIIYPIPGLDKRAYQEVLTGLIGCSDFFELVPFLGVAAQLLQQCFHSPDQLHSLLGIQFLQG